MHTGDVFFLRPHPLELVVGNRANDLVFSACEVQERRSLVKCTEGIRNDILKPKHKCGLSGGT
jgi:hypothetical protein